MDRTDEDRAAERNAIRSLRRLAKRWPRSLTLASMGGALYVIPTFDHDFNDGRDGIDPGKIIADLGTEIPSTGGDW